MSRAYKIRAKVHRVYAVDEVLKLYGICRNTLSNWVSYGLVPSPGAGPQIFRGAELNRFHTARRARGRRQLQMGQFFCLRCKVAVVPVVSSLSFPQHDRGGAMAIAVCSECDCTVMKRLGQTEYDRLREARDTNTSLAHADESKGPSPACVGKNHGSETQIDPSLNDRILHSWQIYAGRFDVKTVDAHLTSIRELDASIGGLCFSQVRPTDVASYRNQLIERGERPRSDGGLSTSTIRHRASHLAGFFRWLCTQDGYRRLGAALPEYFALPRKQMAKALPPPTKEYPTIDDAEDMISSMPGVTRLQRRDKAIVACAFLTGLRAAALLSMKLKHLDTEARMAVQDGREMHAKNGKSFTVRWFPMPENFAHCVVAWKEEISALGFGPDDALFPAGMYLTAPLGAHDNVPVLLTTDPITRAFQQACSGTGNHYTPHAARHCLKALGDRICTTSKALKAWSLNLGHDSLVTTETYYGKMTETDRMRILGDLTAQQGSSDDEKDLMLRYCLHELAPGTPEFKRAKALIRKREEEMEAAAVVE